MTATTRNLKEFKFDQELLNAINNAIVNSRSGKFDNKQEGTGGKGAEPLNLPDVELDAQTMLILIPLLNGDTLVGWHKNGETVKFSDIPDVRPLELSSIGVLFAEGSCWGAVTAGGVYSSNRASWECVG